MTQLEKVKNYLRENPQYLTGKYDEVAKKFSVAYDTVRRQAKKIRNASKTNLETLQEEIYKEMELSSDEELKSVQELLMSYKVDLTTWEVESQQITSWGNPDKPNRRIAVKLKKKSSDIKLEEVLEEYLTNFTTLKALPLPEKTLKPDACLLIPNQDAHYNRLDVHGKTIQERFTDYHQILYSTLQKAKLSYNLDKVIYVIGSDSINSEYNQKTTHGTPQENLGLYEDTFTQILEHEMQMIKMLLKYVQNIEVVLVPGNHGQFAEWAMAQILATYFKEQTNIKFNTSNKLRKYTRYGNSAIMLNHGYGVKPNKLAEIFPMEFSSEWSACNYRFICSGDKHHTSVQDFSGITFYQVPSLAGTSSRWEDESGYITPSQFTAFVITKTQGMTDIYKSYI